MYALLLALLMPVDVQMEGVLRADEYGYYLAKILPSVIDEQRYRIVNGNKKMKKFIGSAVVIEGKVNHRRLFVKKIEKWR